MSSNISYVLKCPSIETLHRLTTYDSPVRDIFGTRVSEKMHSDGNVKWHNHEADMREVSRKNVGVIFTLFLKNSDSGETCRKFFLNGKMQVCPGVVTYDAFDTEKLT